MLVLIEYFLQLTSFDKELLDAASHVLLVVIALGISRNCEKTPFIKLNNVSILFCYAVLAALSSRHCNKWIDIHYPLSIAALSLLTQYSSGLYPFQLANILSIYKAVEDIDHNIGYGTICVVLHGYLLFASINLDNVSAIKNICNALLFTDEHHLVNIQKSRGIALGDLKALPERMHLKNVVNEIKYNAQVPLFFLREAAKIMWQPMIPVYSVLAIMNATYTCISFCESNIMKIIDFPKANGLYVGIMYVVLEFALFACTERLNRAYTAMNIEYDLLYNAIEMHFFRLPLLSKGIPNNLILKKAKKGMQNIFFALDDINTTTESVLSVLVKFVPIYAQVGWMVLIPISMAVLRILLRRCLNRLLGRHDLWLNFSSNQYDDKVDEIYHNIKSIKMFGWEELHANPELEKYWRQFDAKGKHMWYAPIIKCVWIIFNILDEVAEKLSPYIMFYIYMHNNSEATNQSISVANMYLITNLTGSLEGNIYNITMNMDLPFTFAKGNYSIEKALKGGHVNTLTRHLVNGKTDIKNDCETLVDRSKPKIHVENGTFGWYSDEPVLKNMSLLIEDGELVMINGKTGSGKSTLLLSLCGEVKMIKGIGAVVGSLAYVEQRPYIMNDTLRNNILFGRDYDEEFYNKVIYACALTKDINNWADKDSTVIGERGINISGGQKLRLALARAVYSRADIYILDDPLSAVDTQVRRHILDHVIMDSGMLAGKIRIMSSNADNLLPFFDKVLSIDDEKNVSVVHNVQQEFKPLTEKKETLLGYDNNEVSDADANLSNEDGSDTMSNASEDSDNISTADSIKESTKNKKAIRSNWDYIRYVLKMCGATALILTTLLAQVKPVLQFILKSNKLRLLKNIHVTETVISKVIQQYLLYEMLEKLLEIVIKEVEKSITDSVTKKYLETRIKSLFINHIIHLPLSFFDSNTRHEISSAYNSGVEAISLAIPVFIQKSILEVANAVLSIYMVWRNAPQLLLFAPLIMWIDIISDRVELPVISKLDDINSEVTTDQEKLESVIEDGKRLIRIFNVEKYFTAKYMDTKDNIARVDTTLRLFDTYAHNTRYILFNGIVALCKVTVLIQKHIFKHNVSSMELVIYTNLVDELASSISNMIGFKSDILKFKSKVEKLREFMDVDGEKMVVENAITPEKQWPSAGKIELRDFNMRYHEDLELALKNINLTIEPGEKIGIVGRTGAGKTSLTRALFHMVDSKNCTGSIMIDGHDILSLNIRDLRPKLGIIPQEPTMFKGSFRQNLDPLVEYNIEDMWSAVIKSRIVEKVQPQRSNRFESKDEDDIDMNEDISEEIKEWDEDWEKASWSMRLFMDTFIGRPKFEKPLITKNKSVRRHGLSRHAGNSFSEGQQQLFGLCRLLMRNRKIVVLDEATASVDLETDRQVHSLIQSEFKDCTVLTIAHRLETVMRSERVIVMDGGRIVEVGPPAELLASNGHFSELVKANDFGQ